MKNELTTMEKMRGLPWIVTHNGLNSIFYSLTFAGSVFILFLNELGLDKARIGFLLALIPFCGMVSILVAPFTARLGFKRTFLMFYGLRKAAFAFMLFTPLVMAKYGGEGTFIWVSILIFFFAVFRSVAETAVFPWHQEVIPNPLRGKVSAMSTLVATTANILAILLASYVIGHYPGWGLKRYMFLIAFGLVFGVLGVACYAFVPGGKPRRGIKGGVTHFQSMVQSLRDRNFRLFLSGFGLAVMGVSAFAFVPLFLKEQIGLAAGTVVFLDVGSLAGGLLSCYLWGWASDRYGSKPVMLTGLGLLIALPILWFLFPRQSEWARNIAIGVVFTYGIVNMGWAIGWARYLFVSAVPTEKRTTYMAVFYAWSGLVGGLGPLLAGMLLDRCRGLSGQFWFFHFDSFSPLFGISLMLLIAGLLVMSTVRADGAIPVRKFIGMFFQGNPVLALESLVRYGWAGDEDSRVSLLERLSSSKNPLSKNELIEALDDPSFNVRFEAVIAIARMPADPDLVDALLLVLGGDEPDLSIAAAWALGRLGDRSAVLPLQETLLSEYHLLSAHSARALARLKDTDSVPYILTRLHDEPDDRLKLAYASALGTLREGDAVEEMLLLLRRMSSPTLRDEVAFALARIVGAERYYIQLWRATREELGTPVARTLMGLEKPLREKSQVDENVFRVLRECVTRFSREELTPAAETLVELIRVLPAGAFSETSTAILEGCGEGLAEFKAARPEYILLALHVICQSCETAFRPRRT